MATRPVYRSVFAAALLLPATFSIARAVDLKPEEREFFEKRIRPVLANECYECHAGDKAKGGLRLDSRANALKGGDTGPAIIPNAAEKSLLIRSIKHLDPELQMPKKRPKLSGAVIRDFETWIAMGAPDPRDQPDKIDATDEKSWEKIREDRRKWWSFQPSKPIPVPRPNPGHGRGESENPVDRFIEAKLAEQGLPASPGADRSTLIRRASFVLTGLPPDPVEARQFAADPDPLAYSRMVDRLLASPAFGEHWARKWMDLVRYAETHGSEGDPEIREAWRYRDYLVRAFNADVPWNQLIIEHLAGDLIPRPRLSADGSANESKMGPAHLRMVEHGFQPVDAEEDQVRVIENQIDVLGKAFQGLTLACARCHDHKFDPVSQRDYYAMYGIFASIRPAQVTVDIPSEAQYRALASIKNRVRNLIAQQWLEELARQESRLSQVASAEKEAAEIRDARQALSVRRQELLQKMRRDLKPAADDPSRFASLVGRWSFDTVPAQGKLVGSAQIRDGRLIAEGPEAYFRSEPLGRELHEKTLEAWVRLDDVSQRGGGAMTIESETGEVFDSITFAENEPGRWMAGSDFARRTESVSGPRETSAGEWIHLAITYAPDGAITLYRNGSVYGHSYVARKPGFASPFTFSPTAHVLFGLRHLGGGNAQLRGEMDEGRLYDRALSPAEIRRSFEEGPDAVPAHWLTRLTEDERREWDRIDSQWQQLDRRTRTMESALQEQRSWRDAMRELEAAAAAKARPAPLARGQNAQEFGKNGTAWSVDGKLPRWFHHAWEKTAIPGDFSIQLKGTEMVERFVSSGIVSDPTLSKRAGHVTSPRFRIDSDFISVLAAGEGGAAIRLVVDNYPIGNNNTFPKADLRRKELSWIRFDTAYRKGSWAYLEAVTAEDLVRRDDRVPISISGGRSWFELQAVAFHNAPDALQGAAAETIVNSADWLSPARISETISAWKSGELKATQANHLRFLLRHRILSNTPKSKDLEMLIADFRTREAAVPPSVRVPGVVEAEGFDAALMQRGNHKIRGEVVPRGYLEIFGGAFPGGVRDSGRLALAERLVSDANPLTPRVLVNRIWQQVFGEGIVATVDNFGRLGETPSHPELLDYLATQFRSDGWSLKKMLRLLVMSETFRADSTPAPESLRKDPGNRFLSHYSIRRLPAEAIRDALLAVAGTLDRTLGGAPANDSFRRSLYIPVRRTDLNPFLQAFDTPRPFTTIGRRDVTVVPAQSLTLMNDPMVLDAAKAWAVRLIGTSSAKTFEQRVGEMFEAAIGRPIRSDEMKICAGHLRQLARENPPNLNDRELWASFAHSLFTLKEFIYVR